MAPEASNARGRPTGRPPALSRTVLVKKSAGSCPGSVASSSVVLRQAQHEDRFFVASANKNNLILSLSKDEAAAPAAGGMNRSTRRAGTGCLGQRS